MNKRAYQFWYKSDVLSPTEYVYVIAVSEKQAQQIFKAHGYTLMYDWADESTWVRELSQYGLVNYLVGDIVGCDARL